MKKELKMVLALAMVLLLSTMFVFANGAQEETKSDMTLSNIGKIPAGNYYIMIGGENAKDFIDPVTGANIKGWDSLMKPLEEANPGIDVQFVEVPWSSYLVKIATGMESGEYDAVHLAGGQNHIWSDKQQLVSLEKYLDAESDYDANSVFGETFWNSNILTFGGEHYSFPKSGYTFTHIVDTKLFEEAGVPIPADDATYLDLYAAAKAINGKKNAAGEEIYGGFDWSPYETFRALMQTKTKRVDWIVDWPVEEYIGGDLTKLNWDLQNIKDDIFQTLAEMRAFAELMPPGWNNREGSENFYTNKNNIGIMLNTDSGGKFKNLYDSGDLETLSRYKVYPYPTVEIDGKMQLAAAGNVHTWGIPVTAKDPAASYEIIKYLASAEVQKENYETRWLAPIVPEGIEWLNPADPLTLVSMQALQIAHGYEKYGNLSVWSQLYPMVRDNIMFKGLENKDISGDIAQIQTYLDNWLENAIKTGTR